jgi:hypothetical protein
MPASIRTCDICQTEFYGRIDATYCSTACRQKAYRQRSRNARPVTDSVLVSSDPVPIGDTWMRNRFGGQLGNEYATLAEMTQHIEATYKMPATRQKHIAEAEENGLRTIKSYVADVAAIARYSSEEDKWDLSDPLGDELPAAIDPFTARDLAADLQAALPRVIELTALLIRRASTTVQSAPYGRI